MGLWAFPMGPWGPWEWTMPGIGSTGVAPWAYQGCNAGIAALAGPWPVMSALPQVLPALCGVVGPLGPLGPLELAFAGPERPFGLPSPAFATQDLPLEGPLSG